MDPRFLLVCRGNHQSDSLFDCYEAKQIVLHSDIDNNMMLLIACDQLEPMSWSVCSEEAVRVVSVGTVGKSYYQ